MSLIAQISPTTFGKASLSYPLDIISAQASGAYSLRLLRIGYTGPVVNVRRTSDNATLDFFADIVGNLSNNLNSITLDTWLQGTTGFITTWYDQITSNNFTQSAQSRQPQIVKNSNKWTLFFNRDSTPTFFNSLSLSTPQTGIYSIIYNFNCSTTYSAWQTILGQSNNDNRGFRFDNNFIYGDSTASGGRYNQDFLAAAGSYWYLNGQYGNMDAGAVSVASIVNPTRNNGVYVNGVWNHVIGVQNGGMSTFSFDGINQPASTLTARTMYGYLSETIMFKTQLSALDSTLLYSSRYILRDDTTSMTGTPLRSQFSLNAQSSLAAAFSFRSVFGTTAKAVNIKRSTDNVTADFYADRLGNLLTAPVTGQFLQNWLGNANGIVMILYDQTGIHNASGGTTFNILPTNNTCNMGSVQWALSFTGIGNPYNVAGTTFLNNSNFTICASIRRTGTTPNNDGVYGYGANTSWVAPAQVGVTYAANSRFSLVMPGTGSTTIGFNDSSYSPAFSSAANVIPSTYSVATEPTIYSAITFSAAQQAMYVNGALSGTPSTSLTLLNAPAGTGLTIGAVNAYGTFLGLIGEMLVFTSALTSTDVATIYKSQSTYGS